MNKRKLDRMIAFFLMMLCVFLFVVSKGYPNGAGNYPRFLLLVIFLLAAVLMIGAFRKKTREAKPNETQPNPQPEKAAYTAGLTATLTPYLTFGMIVLYVIFIGIFGFFTSSFLFAGSLMFFMGVRNWKIYIYSLAGIGLFIYLLFVLQFDVQLPRGIFF